MLGTKCVWIAFLVGATVARLSRHRCRRAGLSHADGLPGALLLDLFAKGWTRDDVPKACDAIKPDDGDGFDEVPDTGQADVRLWWD